jgi:hypothetical protein
MRRRWTHCPMMLPAVARPLPRRRDLFSLPFLSGSILQLISTNSPRTLSSFSLLVVYLTPADIAPRWFVSCCSKAQRHSNRTAAPDVGRGLAGVLTAGPVEDRGCELRAPGSCGRRRCLLRHHPEEYLFIWASGAVDRRRRPGVSKQAAAANLKGSEGWRTKKHAQKTY